MGRLAYGTNTSKYYRVGWSNSTFRKVAYGTEPVRTILWKNTLIEIGYTSYSCDVSGGIVYMDKYCRSGFLDIDESKYALNHISIVDSRSSLVLGGSYSSRTSSTNCSSNYFSRSSLYTLVLSFTGGYTVKDKFGCGVTISSNTISYTQSLSPLFYTQYSSIPCSQLSTRYFTDRSSVSLPWYSRTARLVATTATRYYSNGTYTSFMQSYKFITSPLSCTSSRVIYTTLNQDYSVKYSTTSSIISVTSIISEL